MSACCLRPDPARIVVPRKHGQVLVEPPMPVLRDALATSCPAAAGELLGVPLAAVRQRAREDLFTAIGRHAALINAPAPGAAALDQPWVLTGHQVEFYHAGVWAKVLATDGLARAAKGLAVDLLVDHDVVDELGFDVPAQGADGKWVRQETSWIYHEGPRVAHTPVPADALPMPSPEQFEAWDAQLARYPAAQSDALALTLSYLKPETWLSLRPDDLELSPSQHSPLHADNFYTPWFSRARMQLEQALDLDVHHVPTSGMCESFAWDLFVLAWIRNAAAWTAAYNRHLAAYRRANDIRNDHHPMPDLHITREAAELPFWIYRVGEPRSRLIVRRSQDGATEIHHGFEAFGLPEAGGEPWAAARAFHGLLASHRLVIRPRALTLTMFVRLFISDLFIHGIGGALYDQITNGILEELFGAAPSYACVSAAWLLPLGQPLEADSDIAGLCSLRHHLRHNPQLAIDPFTALKTDVAELLKTRRDLVEQIAASVARDRKGGRLQRQAWFRELHEVNAALHEKSPQILRRLDEQLARARLAAEQNKVLLWREYYFGLHSMASLRALVTKIRGMV